MSESTQPNESVQTDVITEQRIKEILSIKHQYIDTRATVKIEYETGDRTKAEAVTVLKNILDSFLLDIRPLILSSQYSGVWNNHKITTIRLEEQIERTDTMLSKPTIGVPEEVIQINGFKQMIETPATFEREYQYVTQEFNSRKTNQGDIEAVRKALGAEPEHPDKGDGLFPSSSPSNYPQFGDIADTDKVDIAVMNFPTLDDGYGLATEILAELGIVTQTEEEKEPYQI